MILKLSNSGTIPKNFYHTLEKYTAEGYRVIALAYKDLADYDENKQHYNKRETIEHDLVFLGLMLMENKTKPVTKRCIQQLQDANISTVMATGDNGLTAIAVGRHCGIINPTKQVYLAEFSNEDKDNPTINFIEIDSESKDQGIFFLSYIIENGFNITLEQDERMSIANYKLISDLNKPDQGNPYVKHVLDKPRTSLVEEIYTEYPWDQHPDGDFELAVSGKAFEYIVSNHNMQLDKPNVYEKVLKYAKIYARMSPDHKAMLINAYQESSPHIIGM